MGDISYIARQQQLMLMSLMLKPVAVKVFICAAGLPHLPVPGGYYNASCYWCAIDGGPLNGMDAFFPPCRCQVAYQWQRLRLVKQVLKCRGYLAAQMLAVADDALALKVKSRTSENTMK